jgi:hypothetical protein
MTATGGRAAPDPSHGAEAPGASPVTAAPAGTVPAGLSAAALVGAGGALALQRVAGNAATARWLSRAPVARPQGTGVAIAPEEHAHRHEQIRRKLGTIIRRGIMDCDDGRSEQQHHMDEVRGVVGFVSDLLNEVEPPDPGAWTNAKNLLRQAEERLEADNLKGALSYAVNGYSLLRDAKRGWARYMNASIEGAGETIATLELIRDGALAAEVALLTGGAAAGAIGGAGALTGGVVTGLGAGLGAAATSGTKMGEAVRGTASQMVDAGLRTNLLLAANGLKGLAYGTGEGLVDTAEGLVKLPEHAAKLLEKAADILGTLFADPKRFMSDLKKLPAAAGMIFQALHQRWAWLESLPPEKQAFEIGRLAGHIEAILITIEAGRAAGAAGGELATDVAAARPAVSLGLSGARGAEGLAIAAVQMQTLRAELQAVGMAGGALMAAASLAGGAARGGPGPAKGGRPPKRQLKEGEIADYREFGAKERIGDELEGHEVLSNLWLEVQGIVKRRGKGMASRFNPAIALSPKVHDVVDEYQRGLGLHDAAKVKKMSREQVLSLNAVALRHAGVPDEVIDEIIDEAFDHAVFSAARGH